MIFYLANQIYNSLIMRYLLILLISISACQSLPDNQTEKFKLLNQALEKSVADAREASFLTSKVMKRKVQREGNTPEGLNSLARLEELLKRAYLPLHQIDKIKKQIKNKSPQEAQKLMLGENKNGLAYELKKSLDQYWQYLLTEFKDLGIDSSLILPIAEGKQKLDFAQANFQNTTPEAMLATLTFKAREVVRYQQEILKKHHAGELSRDYSFQSRNLIWVQAVRQAVFAREQYEADVSLVNILPFDYQASWDGHWLTPSLSGVYFGELIASKSGNQEVRVTITYPQTNGVDTTCVIMRPYYVFAQTK
jgi:hypothetical protein